MTIREVTYYTAACDWPDCGADALEGCEFTAWSDPDPVMDQMDYNGWQTHTDGKRHYCPKHPTTRSSDHESGEPYPEPPYLLIHDSDTDNPNDDDRVSLVLGGAS